MSLEDLRREIDQLDDQIIALLAQRRQRVIDAFIELEQREHPAGRRQISSGSPYEPTIGFSRAIRSGTRVLVSGTGPVWPDGSCPEDAGAQARRCFEIIGQALTAASAGWDDVVRTRMFLTDPAVADQVSAVHGELFTDIRPAATMVVVSGLLDPRWKVEIEAEAETGPQVRSVS